MPTPKQSRPGGSSPRPCSPSSDTPATDSVKVHKGRGIWIVNAEYMEEMERQLNAAHAAIRFAADRFERVSWGWDGDCGSKDIISTLEDILPENA